MAVWFCHAPVVGTESQSYSNMYKTAHSLGLIFALVIPHLSDSVTASSLYTFQNKLGSELICLILSFSSTDESISY